ncbi:MAG: adenylate/guanylate cyclase domain-containing protein [Chloroflexi bacterium]|nr:adenylate/guanylate cyclase domain-containing protein [Chloroflexota bacterium]
MGFSFNLLHTLQQRSSDFLFQAANLHQGAETDDKVVIISVDDKSLGQLGHLLSWSRAYHARLVDTLVKAQARVIVFDLLFAESAVGDNELATSLRNATNVILPVISTPTMTIPTATRQIQQSGSFVRPLPIFEQGAIAIGHANVVPDADGVVRKFPIAIHDGSDYEPALALAAVAKYLRRPEVMESPIKDNRLPLAGRFIPVTDDDEMLINYLASPQSDGGIVNFHSVSFVDVLNEEIDLACFQDKIVIIGATASGLGDNFWTPMGIEMNGVTIHAHAIHTILAGNFLRPVSPAITVTLIIILALLCGLAVLHLRVITASLSMLFLCVAYFLIAFFFFDNGIVLNMLYPPLAIAGTFVGLNLYNIIYERSEKRELTETFGRYISPQVVDKILTTMREGELELGGKEYEVTVAFADVRGFTSIAENIPPEELVTILNVYLSAVIEAVLNCGGIINKFGGDSVMAIWNAPVECEGHALLAVKAAVNAQSAISGLKEKEKTIAKMEFGIGINTGTAVAGIMGSEDRLEYSVVGDTVNTAARLASSAPGGKVWIGNGTFAEVEGQILAKPLKPLVVRGKREPIQAYEVLDIDSNKSEE